MKTPTIFLFLFFITAFHFASASELEKIADNHVANGNYIEAFKIYSRICERDSTNSNANYGAGVCIINMVTKKSTAITYLERALRHGCKKT
jgi:hypothetical protein